MARSSWPLRRRIDPISASVRLAPEKLARLASASNSMALAILALVKLAWMRSVLLRLAMVRSAPEKFAPRSTARWKLAPLRFAPARLAPARLRRFMLAPARLQPGQSLVLPARNAAASGVCATAPGASTNKARARTAARQPTRRLRREAAQFGRAFRIVFGPS